MYNVNDILARLQNGESADAIAQSFADVLNQAIAAKSAEDAEKAKEAKRAAEMRAAKVSDLTDILDLVIDFVERYYPDVADTIDLEIAAEDVDAVIDELDKAMDQAKALTNALKTFADPAIMKAAPAKPSLDTAAMSCEDSIMNFLKKNGLM